MRVPDEIRKTVGFIAFEDQSSANAGMIRPVGSCFFVGENVAPDVRVSPRVFAVTAQHVLHGLEKNGVHEAIVRLNKKDGGLATIRTNIADWYTDTTDPSIDVAVIEMGIPSDLDHLVIHPTMFLTPQAFLDSDVQLGEEVFISGLFRHHYGEQRNIPIIRVGNLAALGEERVLTKSFGSMAAYLVEVRSIGGLSGSPAFLNLGNVRVLDGEMKLSKSGIFYVLGSIHGHFDLDPRTVDLIGSEPLLSNEKINSGIAIVTPIDRIVHVLDSYKASTCGRPAPKVMRDDL